MKYFSKLSIAKVLLFGSMQLLPWWRASDCSDCSLKYGFPLAFRQTEGFVGGPRFLWGGLAGDLAIAFATGAVLIWAVQKISATKSQ
jgi:hypothetical protein